MIARPKTARALCLLGLAVLFCSDAHAQRQLELLGRGVIAIRTNSTSVYVGWRMLGTDPGDIGFNLYRSANGGAAAKLNGSPLTNSCNFVDGTATLTQTNAYFVRPVIGGVEQSSSMAYVLPPNAPTQQYISIPLTAPAGGTTPDGSYTYSANDCSLADLDGDGEYEIILKWDPSNSKDNSQSGFTGNVFIDAYKLNGTRLWRIDLGLNIRAGAHYTQFMVYDLDGDGKAELACKTAPGTVDGQGNNVIMGSDDPTIVYTNSSGYVLSGPEYFTIFNGLTGAQLVTTNYVPARGTVSDWGDTYGNRVDRFLACIAYLDGVRPSVVMCRGYYTRTVLVAWDWRNGQLTQRWIFDSNVGGNGAYAGQGNHNLSVADVDGDGKDEILYGSCAIDDNGAGLYVNGYGHGDAMHVSDLNPFRPGLEGFNIHESVHPAGAELHDARTGQAFWTKPTTDTEGPGRGLSDDIYAGSPGAESWSSGGGPEAALWDLAGTRIGRVPGSCNFVIWWDADLTRELLNSTSVAKYGTNNDTTLLSASGTSSNNGTKSTPGLSADLFGDWREEIILRASGTPTPELRIYTTTDVATNRFYTLMHDPQYRAAIAWQNVAYNQPPHPGFYIGPGMFPPPVPPMSQANLIWRGGAANDWDLATTGNWFTNRAWMSNYTTTIFNPGDSVLFDLNGSNNTPVNFIGALSPSRVTVHSPKDYVFGGTGSLAGATPLLKAGPGRLTLNTTNSNTGDTTVTEGTLLVNGSLNQSPVFAQGSLWGTRIAGIGRLGNGLTLRPGGTVSPGDGTNSPGTLTISNALVELGGGVNEVDLSDDPSGTLKTNDLISVVGNVSLSGTNTIQVNGLNGTPPPGTYRILQYSGSLTGGTGNLAVGGLNGVPLTLNNPPGEIQLVITTNRAGTNLVWGGPGVLWDLAASSNWMNGAALEKFVPLDNVRFDNTGAGTPNITLAGYLKPSSVVVDSTANYTFNGSGDIIGTGGLTKTNSGLLTVNTFNEYTGPTILGGGVLSIANLAAGGAPSAIGASAKQSANLVFAGGTLRYTGIYGVTDRGATLNGGGGTIEVPTASSTIYFSGPFVGGGTLTKLGSGTLILAGSSSYSGGTIVRAGTLRLGQASANSSGLGGGSVTLTNAATLQLYGANDDGDTSAGGPFNNPLIIPTNGAGSLLMPFRISINSTLTGGGTLTLRVNGIRGEFYGSWSGFNGQVNVVPFTGADNWLRLNHPAGMPNGRLNLPNGVTLQTRAGGTPTIPLGELVGSAGARISAPGGSDGLPVIWRVGGLNTSVTFAGTVSDTIGFIKEGSGTWTLTGTNSYSGLTTISAGALQIGSGGGIGTLGTGNVTNNASLIFNRTGTNIYAGAIHGSGTLTKLGSGNVILDGVSTYTGATLINAGTLTLRGIPANALISGSANIAIAAGALFDVSSATRTLGAGQTLSGNGSVRGNLIIGDDAVLSPGTSLGTLTFSNSLALAAGSTNFFEIRKSPLTNDLVRVIGALTNGGVLVVTNIGGPPLAAGDSFKLFNAGSYQGVFAAYDLPVLAPGLGWDTSGLAINGTLAVVNAATPPTISSISLSGANFVISGGGGPPSTSFYVLASTNLALPVVNWTRLSTNQFDSSGNFSVTNGFDLNTPQRFYLLQLP